MGFVMDQAPTTQGLEINTSYDIMVYHLISIRISLLKIFEVGVMMGSEGFYSSLDEVCISCEGV